MSPSDPNQTEDLAPAGNAEVPTKTFFGHPRMLANLFSVELWERFSFYGMQAILVYYLYYSAAEGGLGLDRAASTGIIGAYGGMVYLMAIVGGYLGDKILGPERTLFYSAIAIMLGHIALSLIPDLTGVVIGLVLIAVGSGCLKTNASVLVGSLYDLKDQRRDAGFTIFYLGVNIGALIGPVLTNWLWDVAGFHIGFGAAAVGMFLGLVQYALTRKRLPAEARVVPTPATGKEKGAAVAGVVAFVLFVAVIAMTGLLTPDNIDNWVIGLTMVGAVSLFAVLLTSKRTTPDEHSRVLSFIPLWLANVVFWALFQQQFTVMAVYSDTRLDWNLLGMTFKPGVVNSINPIFIIAFGTLFSIMWTKLGDRQPTTVTKWSFGLIGAGIAFLIFLTQAGVPVVSLWWIVLILFVLTLSELCISPTGSSLATKLAPEAHKSQMMALFWTSVAMGTTLAGWLAGFYSMDTEVPYFTTMGLMSIGAGLLVFFGRKPILKLMRGVR